ncbi:MAG TPA: DUF2442 domain-containing protein [Pirellulales bacterium]|nr:DUF2442 domain-containing protein [Pirellulales bacterium]
MLKDLVEARALDGYRLSVRFEDGIEGVVDVTNCIRLTGVFAPLSDRNEFVAVRVDPELGTVVWPCGADLDPDVLYSLVTGQPIAGYESPART